MQSPILRGAKFKIKNFKFCNKNIYRYSIKTGSLLYLTLNL